MVMSSWVFQKVLDVYVLGYVVRASGAFHKAMGD